MGEIDPIHQSAFPHSFQKISFPSGSQSLSGESSLQTTLNFGFRVERVVIPIHGNQALKIGLQRSLMKIIPVAEDEL